MSGAATVEAEDEFIEVGLEVLAAQPVVNAQGPDLEVGEDPVNPRQDDMGGHLADRPRPPDCRFCEIIAPSQTQALAEDMMGGVEKCAPEVWFARDSPLEQRRFELSVPP